MVSRGLKCKPGPRQQGLGGGRDEHLARLRNARYACGLMDGEAAHIVAYELDLASVNPGANRDTEIIDRGGNRPGASNRACWPVEDGKKSIAGSMNLASAKLIELEPHLAVMRQQQLAPGGIPEPLKLRSRVHDIGEEHGGEHAIPISRRGKDPRASELDCLERFAPDNPGIVTGRNVIDIVDHQVGRLTRIALHMELSPKDDTLMMDLAKTGLGDRGDIA